MFVCVPQWTSRIFFYGKFKKSFFFVCSLCCHHLLSSNETSKMRCCYYFCKSIGSYCMCLYNVLCVCMIIIIFSFTYLLSREELAYEMLALEPRASDDETLESEASLGTADSSENLNCESEGAASSRTGRMTLLYTCLLLHIVFHWKINSGYTHTISLLFPQKDPWF